MGRADRIFGRADNPHGTGRCWHCGAVLRRGVRKEGEQGAWHIDHWPVRQEDIHGQWPWGVTSIHDESNMVPACAPCNTSHRWERRAVWWGGASQCPRPLLLAGVLALSTLWWWARLGA